MYVMYLISHDDRVLFLVLFLDSMKTIVRQFFLELVHEYEEATNRKLNYFIAS